MKSNPLVRAWRQRKRLHAWLRKNPRASMQQIAAAFPAYSHEGIRKMVRSMVRDGSLQKLGRDRTRCTYQALGLHVPPLSARRGVLVQSGQKRGLENLKQATAQGKSLIDRMRVPRIRLIVPANEPWRTIHRSNQRCQPNHGAQGSRGAYNGMSSLEYNA